MKNFCKWLGVNEKVAKVVVWLSITMLFLIITNTMLESVGLPFYKVTIENLSKINYPKALEYLLNWFLILLSFYSVIFLVFRVKEFKKIFKYSIAYLLLNIISTKLVGSAITNALIILFIMLFCFIYTKKNWKYLLYGIGAYLLNIGVQFVCYLYKARFIDFDKINTLNHFLTSFDYFIIMFVIIFIKEYIMKKKGGKKE